MSGDSDGTESAALELVVERFAANARQLGWHTQRFSEGKCWEISMRFAGYASRAGLSAEIWAVSEPAAQRLQDERTHFVLIDGIAVDFASRAGLDGDTKPWPLVLPLDEFLAGRGERLPLCPTCGTTDIHPETGAQTLQGHDCPGLLSVREANKRTAGQVEDWLAHVLRAAMG